MASYNVETINFKPGSDKGLHRPDTGQVLLHDGVDAIQPLLHRGEQWVRNAYQKNEENDQNRDGDEEDQAEMDTQRQGHDDAADGESRCTYQALLRHLDEVLHLLYILGEFP